MTEISSNVEKINNSATVIYAFISNLNNFKELMPDQIENWNSTEDTCSFRIKNMADLSLKLSEKIQNSRVVLIPDGKTPFVFQLACSLEQKEDNSTYATVKFFAELNPMMQMLAKTPLQNFVNILAAKLKHKFDF